MRRFQSNRALLAVLVFVGAACSDSPTSKRPGIPAQLDIVSGNLQIGTVGTELPAPLVIRVLDAAGRPVSGQLVNFRVTAGGGSVFAGSALTNADGIAQERWTLGTSTDGEQHVEARAVSSSSGAALVFGSFGATARSGPAASIAIMAGADQSALAGAALAVAPSIRVRDQYGNPVPSVAVTFTVTGGGSLTNAAQTTDANGVATAGTWTLGPAEGVQTLTASSGTAATSIPAVARSRSPAQLSILAGDNQSGVVGAAVAIAPIVLVRNAAGDALPGVTVTFAPTAGSGSVTGASVTTDALGRATLGSWTLGTGVGTQSLAVSVGALSAQVSATATSGAIATLTLVTPFPSSAEVASDAVFAVRAADQFGNPVGGAAVTFEVIQGGGSVSSATVTTATDGSASATWTLGTAVGQNSARARVSSGASVMASVGATAGAAARAVKHAGDNQTAIVGTAVAVRPAVLIEDRFGNPVPNATVNFVIGTGGGNAGGSAVSGADGIASTSQWVLGTLATSNTLTASSVGTGAVTFSAIALPGPVTSLSKVAGDGQVAPVGGAVPVRPAVVARDAHGNAVPGVPVSFVVTVGGGAVAGGSATTDQSGGAAVESWVVGTVAGQQELTATAEGAPPVTFMAEARNRAASRIVAHPANVTAAIWGDVIAPSVIVLDEFGGPVQGVPVTFILGSVGAITGANAMTDADGIATVGSWRLLSCIGPSTLFATSPGLADLSLTPTVVSNGASQITSDLGQSFSLNYSIDGNGNLGLPLPRVRDGCGRGVAGAAVTFTTDERSFMDFGDGIAITDASGTATKGRWRPVSPGVTTLTVSTVDAKGQTHTAGYQATVYHGAPAGLVKLAGDEQTGPAGSTLPVAPKVLVVDRAGNPAPQYITPFAVGASGLPAGAVSIRFSGLSGGSGAVTLVVNADGTVTAPPWTLGLAPGIQSVVVTNPNPPYSASPIIITFTAQATAPPPSP
jgi:adhesin/invasin